MISVYIVIGAAVIGLCILLITKPRQKKGMYPRGGPRWKNSIGYLMIRNSWKKAGHFIDPEIVNDRVTPPEGTEEQDYNDSFVFQGSDENGNLLMTRLGFRDNGKNAEIWMWTALEGKVYANTTKSLILDPPNRTDIEAAGLAFHCEDMQEGRWRIEYSGTVEPGGLDCRARFSYEPDSAIYHSGVHMDPGTFARAMAEMPWTKEFFENLKSESQTRIEQGGRMYGAIAIGGKEYALSLRGVRDHSWGKRNWKFIKRYIWNVLSLTEPLSLDGKEYSYLCYTTVNYGTSFQCLVSGWIAGNDAVLPIVAATNQREIGEDGRIPEKISCWFQPKGCPPLELRIDRTGSEYSWYMGDGGFEVCEAYCSFEVNGRKGIGMSEFGYSKEAGYTSRFED